MNLKDKVSMAIALKMAESINKESFLEELKINWMNELPKEFNIEVESEKAWKRITSTPSYKLFQKVNITKEDITKILEEIKCGKY